MNKKAQTIFEESIGKLLTEDMIPANRKGLFYFDASQMGKSGHAIYFVRELIEEIMRSCPPKAKMAFVITVAKSFPLPIAKKHEGTHWKMSAKVAVQSDRDTYYFYNG